MTRIILAIAAFSPRRSVWVLPMLAVLGCGDSVSAPEPVELVGTWVAEAPGGTITLHVWRGTGTTGLQAMVGMYSGGSSLEIGATLEIDGPRVRIESGNVFRYDGEYRGDRLRGEADLPLAEVSFPLEFRRL